MKNVKKNRKWRIKTKIEYIYFHAGLWKQTSSFRIVIYFLDIFFQLHHHSFNGAAQTRIKKQNINHRLYNARSHAPTIWNIPIKCRVPVDSAKKEEKNNIPYRRNIGRSSIPIIIIVIVVVRVCSLNWLPTSTFSIQHFHRHPVSKCK